MIDDEFLDSGTPTLEESGESGVESPVSDENVVSGESYETLVFEVREIRDSLLPHDLLYTNFADYTVTEGLLLCILLVTVMQWIIKILKGGFGWLMR